MSLPLFPQDLEGTPGLPALLTAAAVRAGASPTALAQARLPLPIRSADRAFDGAVAAALAAYARREASLERRAESVNNPLTPPL